MITIIVGVPGAGKTLFVMSKLYDEYKDRPVYHYNIPGVNVDAWHELEDPTLWHTLPHGSVSIIDEAHKVFPKRDHRIDPPPHIEAAGELRHSGHDLVLITQHPVDLDIFLRRRCARFIYIKKPLTKGDYATVYVWGEYNENYKDSREHESADSYTFTYPKEAFSRYISSELHTGKKYVPNSAKRAFYALIIGVVVAVSAALYGFHELSKPLLPSDPVQNVSNTVPVSEMSPDQYIKRYLPRVQAMPATAPIYDHVIEAKTFPRLQCVSSKTSCKCWTQQATRLYIPDDICRRYVTDGIFDWTRDEDNRHG